MTNGLGGFVTFVDSSRAAQSTFVIGGATTALTDGGDVSFNAKSSAADATFIVEGGTGQTADGGSLRFFGASDGSSMPSAGNATVIANGGTASLAFGGSVYFFNRITPSEPTLIANGGANGGRGGYLYFQDGDLLGNLAHVELFGNGLLNVSQSFGTTIGSLEGDGLVDLGDFNLTVGGNNQSTSFSGLIEEVFSDGFGGSLQKIGSGTLRLSHANTFKRGIVVSDGSVLIENETGSGSGFGDVTVQKGTLGGNGRIAGAVTIGTGTGLGAFLAPAGGTRTKATLTMQSLLTFSSDATYTYTYRAKRNTASTDLVVANGVTINSGATLDFDGTINGRLTPGLVFTVISNTSATPITGTFSNLPDGSTIVLAGNTFQANYDGGDGNDLTLTVQ